MTTAIDERRAELGRLIEAADDDARHFAERAAARQAEAKLWRAELAGIEWAMERQPPIVLNLALGAERFGNCQNESAHPAAE